MLLKKLFFTIALLFSCYANAETQLRVLTGTKVQTFNGTSQGQAGESPLGLLAMVDFELSEKWYISIGTSFEMSTNTFSTSGFALYGSAMYYLYGSPKEIQSFGELSNADMSLYYPYSLYVNAGIYDKDITLRLESNPIAEEQDVGGVFIGFGGHYNLNSRLYLSSHIQALSSGRSTNAEYSSFEFYFGIGMRI